MSELTLDWKRNYEKEGMRAKDEQPFEWYTASWFIVSCHVHNRTLNRSWKFVMRGARTDESRDGFGTKGMAMNRVENIIALNCKDYLIRHEGNP